MKILILDCKRVDSARAIPRDSTTDDIFYLRILKRINPQLQLVGCQPYYNDFDFQDYAPRDFDGVIITGSRLHLTEPNWQIDIQQKIISNFLDAGVPVFGSCWGMQLATVVLGGKVGASLKGREFFVARNLRLSVAGKQHPMMRGRQDDFCAIAVHYDEVTELASGSTVLAHNKHCAVQAITIKQGHKQFWGVQYHPEFNLQRVATIARLERADLVQSGHFANLKQVDSFVEHLQDDSADGIARLRWLYGLDQDVLSFQLRSNEINNWLNALANKTLSSKN